MGFLDKLLGRSKKIAQQGMGAADKAVDRARAEVDERRHGHDHPHDEPATMPADAPSAPAGDEGEQSDTPGA
jgi:hypothetical protein